MSTVNTDADSFRDKVATVDGQGKRVWLYPQRPRGPLYRARAWVSAGYLVIFFLLPFIKMNGHPVFLANILERRFILFGQVFWPQDFFIFGLGMILFIVFIALFTVVFGRVFCGWACPQTVFMEMVFRRIEYLIEGDAAQQRIWDRKPWGTEKLIRKISKWIIFWGISFLIANTFLAYIIGVDELRKIVTQPPAQHPGGFLAILIFTTVFFFVYAWFREQVCTVVCPYGRLQGVLLDKNSIVVAYDYGRGEQRKKFSKKETRDAGDCIDCYQCVKVCPTGIDIRNGTQLECVNCTACIDVCDKMMEAVNLPKGLIRYASEQNISERRPSRITPRIKAYSIVMLLLLGVEIWLLAGRTDIDVSVLRTPGQLYQEQPDNRISNLYNYRLLNKTWLGKKVTLKPENFEGNIRIIGREGGLAIPKEGSVSGSMLIFLDRKDVTKRKTKLDIGIYENGKKVKTVTTSFLGPFG